jgi:hypothetical protein
MIIIKEKQNLDEMAVRVISSKSDNLPFKITIQAPDHLPPHAHVRDLETGKKELGQFEISKSMPHRAEDIKNYKQGIPDEWRSIIFRWANARCAKFSVAKNWEVLWFEWGLNESD